MGQLSLLGAGNSGGSPLLLDDLFNDTDGTALTAHSIAPANNVGASWAIDASAADFTISSNTLEFAGAGAAHQCYVNATQSDVTVTVVKSSGDNQSGPMGRYSDSNNRWTYYYGGIWEKTSGTETERASGGNPGNGDTITMTFSGGTITVQVNGSQVCTYGSATTNQTATEFGFTTDSNSSAKFSSFKVTNP